MTLFRIGTVFRIGNDAQTPALTVAADGTLSAIGDYSTYSDGFIELTRYARDGTLLSDSDVLSNGAYSLLPVDEAVTLINGNIVTLHTVGAGSYQPYIRIYREDGTPLTDYMQVPGVGGAGAANVHNYAIEASPDGGFVVTVGYDASYGTESADIAPNLFQGLQYRQSDVRVVEYDNFGNLIYNPYFANYINGSPLSWVGSQTSTGFAVLNDGRIVVPYSDTFYTPDPFAAVLHVGSGGAFAILDEGRLVSESPFYIPPFGLLPNNTYGYSENMPVQGNGNYTPFAVALSGGGFAIFSALPDVDGFRWQVEFFDPGGASLGAALDLSGLGGSAMGQPFAAGLPGDALAFVGADYTDLTGRDIYLHVIRANGSIESTLVTHTGTAQNDSGINDLVVGVDGTIMVSVNNDEVYRFGLSDQALRAPAAGGTVVGTLLADLIIGRDGDDALAGGYGADQIEGHGGDDTIWGGQGDDILLGGLGDDRIYGDTGDDDLLGADGADTLSGGDGNDTITGGATEADRRDVIYGGDGDDSIDAGWGNDEVGAGAGNDTVIGGYGADTLIGNEGDDRIDGGVNADVLFGNDGNDVLNGGFANDRYVGGAGADGFYHNGTAQFATDWIQDYSAAEGDQLRYGGAATIGQFQVNFARTPAGENSVAEAFVVHRPSGQILWALVDGADQTSINIVIGGVEYDLLAL